MLTLSDKIKNEMFMASYFTINKFAAWAAIECKDYKINVIETLTTSLGQTSLILPVFFFILVVIECMPDLPADH